jgi:hypothetical protein
MIRTIDGRLRHAGHNDGHRTRAEPLVSPTRRVVGDA